MALSPPIPHGICLPPSPMASSRVLSPTHQSAWKDPALGGASLALKIAKEATMGVPLLSQIFGVAHGIAELAEKAERNKDALRMLAEKAATLSQLVEKILSDRTVDNQLAEILERLVLVIGKVENFHSKETAKSNVIKKMYRTLLVTKKKTEELANELQTEIHGFMVATVLDTRLYLSEMAQHDEQFRRLRDYEVRKLGVISEYRSEHGTATVARARVEGVPELMVVKYIEGTVPNGQTSTKDILITISSLKASHPNIARVYGWGRQNGRISFTVIRTGVRRAADYLNCRSDDVVGRYKGFVQIQYYVLAASAYLQGLGIIWFPESFHSILVDDDGQPSIGAFDDLLASESYSRHEHAVRVCSTLDHLRLFNFAPFVRVRCKEVTCPASCDQGRLKVLMETIISHNLPTYIPSALQEIWTVLCGEELFIEVATVQEPIVDCNSMSSDTLSQALRHDRDLSAYQYPPIPHQQSHASTSAHSDKAGRYSSQADWLEVEVDCRLVCNTGSWLGHEILYGLYLGVRYRNDTVDISYTYVIEFSEAVTADVKRILNLTDTSADPSHFYFSRELFFGVIRVPEDRVMPYVQ